MFRQVGGDVGGEEQKRGDHKYFTRLDIFSVHISVLKQNAEMLKHPFHQWKPTKFVSGFKWKLHSIEKKKYPKGNSMKFHFFSCQANK